MENRLRPNQGKDYSRPSWKAHYVVAILVKRVERTLYVLCFKRRQNGSKELMLRLPGSRQEREENRLSALMRTCKEKIGCSIHYSEWKEGPTTFQPAGISKRPQVAYIVDVTNLKEFSFRSETKSFQSDHGLEELMPPEWVPVEVAMKTLFFSHRAHLLHSLPVIRSFGSLYADIIDLNNPYVIGTGSCSSCHN